MRRFSQRSHLVTLSEINITPLLDLAFVLLIIFIITTPIMTLEQSISLKLPQGGQPDKPLDKRDIRTVEVTAQGVYLFDRRATRLDQIEAELVQDFRRNPKLIVYIRADENGAYKNVAAVIDRCQRNGITRFSLRTEPVKR